MTATIYALCDLRVSDPIARVRYIGQTSQPLDRRLARHWQTANAGAREHRAVWMRSVRAAAGDVAIEPLAVVSLEQIDAAEIEAIARWRSLGADLTNCTDGGGGVRGIPVSDATRQKMRESASRRKASPTTIEHMRAAAKRSHARPETRARLRAVQIGRRRSVETRAKMATARRGEGNGIAKLTWAAVATIRARYAAGGCTLKALAAEYGVSVPAVHRVVHGRGWVAA